MAPEVDVDPEREEAELRAYLGDRFELGRLQRWEETVEREFEHAESEDEFYRSSEGYLYNLTAFAMTGTKLPYLAELISHVPPGARVLDYGCGIGSDGLALAELGYRVAFADYDNPSVEYLRWRLHTRGLSADVYDLDVEVPGGFDAVFALDVIEHVEDPWLFLEQLERRADDVMVNFLEPEPGETDLHHDLPIDELLAHVSSLRLRSYRHLHGRSHLVVYSPQPAGPVRRRLQRRTMDRTRRAAGAPRPRLREAHHR